ncbi:hypothetical protein DFH08DRAFT_798613 [Mycena albidolilacea]|uniref:Uncharacterized protein n=1 Tax=Mycena albidolilacea TaxID=1033008 RepID=A0AAD7APG5_9AGAR|nr:hypothetical protein DFH08DRAFT_798613 [Mycena albidolilacea]
MGQVNYRPTGVNTADSPSASVDRNDQDLYSTTIATYCNPSRFAFWRASEILRLPQYYQYIQTQPSGPPASEPVAMNLKHFRKQPVPTRDEQVHPHNATGLALFSLAVSTDTIESSGDPEIPLQLEVSFKICHSSSRAHPLGNLLQQFNFNSPSQDTPPNLNHTIPTAHMQYTVKAVLTYTSWWTSKSMGYHSMGLVWVAVAMGKFSAKAENYREPLQTHETHHTYI